MTLSSRNTPETCFFVRLFQQLGASLPPPSLPNGVYRKEPHRMLLQPSRATSASVKIEHPSGTRRAPAGLPHPSLEQSIGSIQLLPQTLVFARFLSRSFMLVFWNTNAGYEPRRTPLVAAIEHICQGGIVQSAAWIHGPTSVKTKCHVEHQGIWPTMLTCPAKILDFVSSALTMGDYFCHRSPKALPFRSALKASRRNPRERPVSSAFSSSYPRYHHDVEPLGNRGW